MPAPEPARSDELELELRQVRSRAEAARLEARAAELELLLRKSTRRADPLLPDPTLEQLAVRDWQQLLAAAAALPTPDPPPTPSLSTPPPATPPTSTPLTSAPPASNRGRTRPGRQVAAAAVRPADPDQRDRPPLSTAQNATAQNATAQNATAQNTAANRAAKKAGPVQAAAARATAGAKPPGRGSSAPRLQRTRGRAGRKPSAAGGLAAGREERAEPVRRRKRPAAWIVSSVAHGVVLLVLAATTVSVAQPVEQFTLDATPPEASDEPLETVVLEQSAAPEEASEPSPAGPVAELIPAATLLGGEIEVALPEMPAPSSFTALDPLLPADGSLAAKPTASTASEFFGAQGGGNHFVYLVDNSHSMTTVAGDGFDVARRELLKSIEGLSEEQRFYVIFFGEQVLRMRLTDPAIPEPRSVYATAANKAALRRWAMGITMQPGRWPEQALEFAFELRPDVIFLLTDGEMSQRAEPMIRQHNLVENLFEGPHPRSTIHTIGFYSRDGAEQMQQIARVNGGTYHFVPPPPR